MDCIVHFGSRFPWTSPPRRGVAVSYALLMQSILVIWLMRMFELHIVLRLGYCVEILLLNKSVQCLTTYKDKLNILIQPYPFPKKGSPLGQFGPKYF